MESRRPPLSLAAALIPANLPTTVPRPRLAPAFLTGSALALACVAWLVLAVELPAMATGASRSDLMVFRDSAHAWLAGGDPYATKPWPNLNHPAFLVATAWTALVPYPAAFAAWSAALLAAYAATLGALARVARPALTGWCGVVVAALALSAPGFAASLLWGQVGIFLGLGATLCWLAARRGHWLAASVWAGVLIALKPSLLPLALVFLATGRRRGLAGVALGGGGLSLAATPFVGVAGYLGWARALLRSSGGAPSISLAGFVAHLLGHAAPGHVATAVQLAAALATAALVLAVPRRGVPGGDRDVSAALLLALLGSPLGWAHYLATLAPVAGALGRRRRRLTPALRGATLAAAGVLWVPGALGMGGMPVDQAQTLGLLVLLAVVVAIHRPVPRPAQPTARGEYGATVAPVCAGKAR